MGPSPLRALLLVLTSAPCIRGGLAPLQSGGRASAHAGHAANATSSRSLVAAYLKTHGYLGGELSGAERAALEQGPNDPRPIYVEVAAPKGSSRSVIETRVMEKYAPGRPAFKVTEEDRIIRDDGYKTQMLNYLIQELDAHVPFCRARLDCIATWATQDNGAFHNKITQVYADSADEGCLAVGGCKAEAFQAFSRNVQQMNNVIFESTDQEYKGMQARLSHIRAFGRYKMNIMVAVAMNYATAYARASKIASTNVYNFLQNPTATPAPRLFNPREFAAHTVDFVCTMNSYLDCLSHKQAQFQGATGPQLCDPMVDAIYMFDNTEQDGADRVAVAVQGGNEGDKSFINARNALKKALPPGSHTCSPRRARAAAAW